MGLGGGPRAGVRSFPDDSVRRPELRATVLGQVGGNGAGQGGKEVAGGPFRNQGRQDLVVASACARC